MSNKHKRNRVSSLQQRSTPTRVDDVPRSVVVNFDRWIEAHHLERQSQAQTLEVALKRSGWMPRKTPGIDGTPVFWLQRL